MPQAVKGREISIGIHMDSITADGEEGDLTLHTTDGHAGPGSNKGREGLAVGGNKLATLAGTSLRLVEVEDELLVIWEQGKAISGPWSVLAGTKPETEGGFGLTCQR